MSPATTAAPSQSAAPQGANVQGADPQGDRVDVRHTLLEADPFDAPQVALLGQALAGHQPAEVRQALAELEKSIAGGKDSPRHRKAAGITALLLGMHEKAEATLAGVQGDGLAAYYLAQSRVAQRKYDEAAETFQRAAAEGFDEVQAELERAGAVRLSGDVDRADELLTAVSRKAATRAEYSYQKGCVLADRGDTSGAMEYFERAVDMDPRHSRATFRLAGLNALLGEDAEAIRLYEQSLSKPPLFLGALINLGLLYEDQENYPAAAYCFRRVLEVYPNHERARLFLKDVEAAGDMYYDEDLARRQRELEQVMRIPITDFELTARSRNGLERAGINTLGDLTQVSEAELLAAKNFGETSLNEIKEILDTKGLRVGQMVELESTKAAAAPVQGPLGAVTPKIQPAFGGGDDLSPAERAKLERPVADLQLSVRARKCLTRLGIQTLGELVSRTPDELMSVRNFGVTSLNEIRQKLVDFDIKLRND